VRPSAFATRRTHSTGAIAASSAQEQRLAAALSAIATGDDAALAVLLEVLAPRARRHLAPFGLDADEVDDALQATYIELHRTAARFDPTRGGAYAYCFTILRRRAIDLVRRRREAFDLDDVEVSAQPIDDVDARLDLEGVVTRLPDELRQTAMLWVHGYARDEIAWVTGRDRATTAASLRRTQRSLRALGPRLR
jgi:RNA polymerase sigma-70 factor (ECF subfamily)